MAGVATFRCEGVDRRSVAFSARTTAAFLGASASFKMALRLKGRGRMSDPNIELLQEMEEDLRQLLHELSGAATEVSRAIDHAARYAEHSVGFAWQAEAHEAHDALVAMMTNVRHIQEKGIRRQPEIAEELRKAKG